VKTREVVTRFLHLIVLFGVIPPSLWGQAPAAWPHSGATGDSASTAPITAGAQYRRGGLHRALLGDNYRRLWTKPIWVPVLDFHHYAGGLRAVERGGGLQTNALHLDAADGRKFRFRSVNKDGTLSLSPQLRRSAIGRIWQDEVSALYPAGALVVPPLLQSVGVRTLRPQLFIMPYDPALGAFQKEFSGMLGMLEEWPTPAFQGTQEIIKTGQMYERLTRDPHQRVDSRAFLAARLMDIYVGDADRREKQWLWLRRGDGNGVTWQPLGVDRDYAFVRFGGLLPDIARMWYPMLVDFGNRYPSMLGLNWRASSIDRRLLGELDWATWDSVAQALTSHLPDSIIDLAVRQVPEPYYQEDGTRLRQALRKRRDQLSAAARQFYWMIAQDAEVYGTDADEVVVATRGPNGTLDLAIRTSDATAGGDQYYHRRFYSESTKEVRLFLHGGVDTVHVRGTGGGPKLRVLGDSGTKIVSDVASGGWTRLYGPKPVTTVLRGTHQVSVDRRLYRQPDSTSVIPAAPRYWGHWWTYSPWIRFDSDRGALIGAGATLLDYGFRRNPHAFRLDFRGGYGTDASAFAGEISGDLRRENSATQFLFRAYASGADVRRFFGFGNETPRTGPSNFYKVYGDEYQLSTALGWSMGRYLTARLGPVVKYSRTDFSRGGLIGVLHPYGSGDFGELGGELGLSFDSRDTVAAPARGAHIAVEGHVYPSVWDVTSTFGEAHGEAATYLTAPISLRPTLALRAAGKRVWGSFPLQEAAFIGGLETVRGLDAYRFQGHASAYGNVELRVPVSKLDLLAPGELGVFGLADVGRVWVEGESSDKWHTAFGGGLSIAYLNRRNTVTVAVARGERRTALYLRSGFMF
jgi:hypothetical protein